MLIKVITLFFSILLYSIKPSLANDLYIEKKNEVFTTYIFDYENNTLIESDSKDATTPLGSLWKLFVFAYNKENSISNPQYTCNGYLAEEIFCCKKGESIDEETALIKSCGLYFTPNRLRISKNAWKSFWTEKKINFDWIKDLNNIKPDYKTSVHELLSVIEEIKNFPKSKNILDKTLIRVILEGTAKGSFSELGAYSRIKTYTWDNPHNSKEYIGGFSGWLNNGTIIWAIGDGKSSEFLSRASKILDKHWKNSAIVNDNQCITVRFFHDYKITSIINLTNNLNVSEGVLNGKYLIKFNSGRELTINSNSEVILNNKNGVLYIDGRMDINSYIARVIDREIDNNFSSAAEAFSIVIRSYIQERAQKISGCYHVIDSSKFQRVSVNIPSQNSLAISSKTSGLILNNASSIRYHLNEERKNQISWIKAKGFSLLGLNFEKILLNFYPNSKVVYSEDRYSNSCGSIENANNWLKEKSLKWHKKLLSISGYERPQTFNVCKLSTGAPFSNKNTNEIFVRGFDNFENQFSVAHEYLHLAFKYHPIGDSETDIDNIAKKLVTLF